MNKYEIEDLIFCVYDIDQREDLSEPYVKFELMYYCTLGFFKAV